MDTVNFSKQLSVKKKYDVIVAGGGVAGVAAAVSVAKRGRSVLLLEKSNILGGLGTLGLINMFVPMFNSPINAGAAAMIAGLILVPVVSLLTPKMDPNQVDALFECYEETTVVHKKVALPEQEND